MSVKMTEYESSELVKVEKWMQAEPGVVTQVVGTALKPAAWLLQQIVPKKVIEGVLLGFDKAAEFLTDTGDVLRDGGVKTVEELRGKNLELSDKMANSVHNWAVGLATGEGAATGIAGAPGLVVDIPAVIGMALRVIHKIGICYGYQADNPAERQFVFGIMSAAGANTMKEKVAAMATLQKIAVMVAKMGWRKLAADKTVLAMGITAIKNLAKQLGVNLTKRKVAQIVPIIGAGVGAAMNGAFINDVAWAARRMYQRRWLEETGKIKLPEA